MPERIDPRHEAKRTGLSVVALIMLALGVVVLVYGLVLFGSNFFRPSSEFFADPERVMDETRRNGFIGVICVFLGGVASMFGGGLLVFARAGSIVRYFSKETSTGTEG